MAIVMLGVCSAVFEWCIGDNSNCFEGKYLSLTNNECIDNNNNNYNDNNNNIEVIVHIYTWYNENDMKIFNLTQSINIVPIK